MERIGWQEHHCTILMKVNWLAAEHEYDTNGNADSGLAEIFHIRTNVGGNFDLLVRFSELEETHIFDV